ncbi:MAG: sorbosone dehydrogenase family protein [Alphaproteobacteria bacterium]|nr:sorbosone dehydrogenase family protein [Alphaproteobacteria bacterium]
MRPILLLALVLSALAGSDAKAMTIEAWRKALLARITLPPGYSFSIFAEGLGRPRLMQMTEAGDLLASSSRDGAILLVSADGNGDGASDGQRILAAGLNRPHGLLLEGNRLYVAEEHRVIAYDFDGARLSGERIILEGLPDDGGHATRTLKRGPDGLLYLSIGSSRNVCIEDHPWRATIIRFAEGKTPEIFAKGLRNTVGFAWRPGTGELYGVDNGRDNLGDDVPDDEVNLITAGGHYGWPYVHGAGVADPELHGAMPKDLSPLPQAHGLGAHVAPLSITFLRGESNAALVAEHGSWNRSRKSGHRLVKLTFSGGAIAEEVFLSGCEVEEDVICRPVDVLEAEDGALFVSDDYTGAIYRIASNR